MKNSAIETVLAFAVIIVTAWFLIHAHSVGVDDRTETYNLSAQFFTAPGVTAGDHVMIAGIPIGHVTHSYLDPESYFATVEMAIQTQYQIPEDSALGIKSGGLMGGTHITIIAGQSDIMLAPGAEILKTKEPVSITDQIGRTIFSGGIE